MQTDIRMNTMENSFKFFENRKCEYFPCHKGLKDFNCLFCYCPFYDWDKCPGNSNYIEVSDGKKIKDCSFCNLPHVPDNYDFIIETLRTGKKDIY